VVWVVKAGIFKLFLLLLLSNLQFYMLCSSLSSIARSLKKAGKNRYFSKKANLLFFALRAYTKARKMALLTQ
jgi:hypothetical protein